MPDYLCEIGDLGDVEGAYLGIDDENDVDGGYADEPRCNCCDF
ncbi:MAG: hypothetical protein P8R42_04760 [Candidatus Binatia bacterium]|nr:hypothetical protein [Candidatus Binatia bacterium]